MTIQADSQANTEVFFFRPDYSSVITLLITAGVCNTVQWLHITVISSCQSTAIGGATIVTGNLAATNGLLHIIDKVGALALIGLNPL